MEKSVSNDCSPVQKSKTVVLSSLCLAPIGYYSMLFRSAAIIIEAADNFQKQSYRNRYDIVAANGVMTLSIPVEKANSPKTPMRDIRISDHGNWRHVHWNAIVSAYNSSPFFEYLEDDFRPFYEKEFTFLFDFNEELRRLIFKLLSIDIPVDYSTEFLDYPADSHLDLRESIHPKRKSNFKTREYYQVFSNKHGFVQHASIIDLLFNMGNESRLYL